MEIVKKYVVYEMNSIMGSDNISLKEVEFKGITSNRFDDEEDAIKALVEEQRPYEEFLIIKKVIIVK